VLVQLGFFFHMQLALGSGTPAVTRPIAFATAFMLLFSVVIALFKDIPDIAGDKQVGGSRGRRQLAGPQAQQETRDLRQKRSEPSKVQIKKNGLVWCSRDARHQQLEVCSPLPCRPECAR
jgi:hypothetical protein